MKTFDRYITEKIKLSNDRFNKKINSEYVDFDLPSGTLWATCNLGANKPWETGDYYAWGETEEKIEYKFNNYKFYGQNQKNLIKYTREDRLIELEPEDDAATINLGNNWHIPTYDQIKELLDYTEHDFVFNYNNTKINGMLFKENGEELFIPASGYFTDKHIMFKNCNCYIWSSTLLFAGDDYFKGRHLCCFKEGTDRGGSYRELGLQIRPVLNK